MIALADELELPEVRSADLLGTWYIVRTNFPMWTGGKNSHPTLNYEAMDEPGCVRDVVRYRSRGKAREILGVDRQDPELSCHFVWRGSGLLKLLRSDWYIVDLDASAQVAAIFFTKTLFTPEGLDVASRSPTPDPAVIAACLDRLRAAPSLGPHIESLSSLGHG